MRYLDIAAEVSIARRSTIVVTGMTHALVTIALSVLIGCSTPDQEDPMHGFDAGWVKGRVVQILPGEELMNPGFWTCTQNVSQRGAPSYARVRYRLRSEREHLVPVPPDQHLQAGDAVWVNLDRCENAIETRQLPAHVPKARKN
jgi:hypothetical protein